MSYDKYQQEKGQGQSQDQKNRQTPDKGRTEQKPGQKDQQQKEKKW
ncbi:MAG: hypothetical protein JO149_00385 [Gammaproteobacteria bacterium]|nr:hypothetical protein [Gammaproteobacteria bacterium]